jgi:type I restriction enzyme S subunit
MNKVDLPAAPTAQARKRTRLRTAIDGLWRILRVAMTKPMNKVEKLIAELCPDGVEFRELGEVCNFRNGFAFKSNRFKITGSPIISIGNIQNGIVDLNNLVFFNLFGLNSPLLAAGRVIGEYKKNLTSFEVNKGDILIAMSGATTGKIGYLNSDETYYLNQRVGKFEPYKNHLNNRYLYHYLLSKNNELYILAGGGAQPNLSSNVLMKKIQIPLPPLTIQKEIVKILNTFTKLEAELEARKKQYEYYRDELLTFGEGVEIQELDEICVAINAGGDLPERYLKGQLAPTKEFPYPIFSNGSAENALYGYTNSYKVGFEAVTISARGTIGYHAVRAGKFTPIVRLITLIPKTEIITAKFLNYALDITEIGHSGGSIPQLTVPNVKKIKIPIPPLAEQERIVAILDKFDALVNGTTPSLRATPPEEGNITDLTGTSPEGGNITALTDSSPDEGNLFASLQAELNARRKQYEYYRNKLLTFKEFNSPPLEGCQSKTDGVVS